MPWAERIRFVSSGTEAVMSALRVARRRHRTLARAQVRRLLSRPRRRHARQGGQRPGGAGGGVERRRLGRGRRRDPRRRRSTTRPQLDRVFDAHGTEIAAAIVEPLPANYGLLPQREDGSAISQPLCRDAGALADLRRSDLRLSHRQDRHGRRARHSPGSVTFGKVIGGGFPVGAYAGRARLMDRVAPSGTCIRPARSAPIRSACAPAWRRSTKMDRLDGWRVLDARAEPLLRRAGRWLRRSDRAARRRPRRARSSGFAAAPDARSGGRTRSPRGNGEWFSRFFHAAIERGVYLPPSAYEVGFVSMAHDDADARTAATALVAAAREADTP